MNTITNTASNNPILAIDLGKFKSVACVYDTNCHHAQFVAITTAPAFSGATRRSVFGRMGADRRKQSSGTRPKSGSADPGDAFGAASTRTP